MSASITSAEHALAVAAMRALQERGMVGGLEGLRLLKRERMREIEPHAGGVVVAR
jgi:hypothetical protein